MVVDKAQGKDEEVKEDPDEEKQTAATLVNHPDFPLFGERSRLERLGRGGRVGVNPLKWLQTPSLGLVSLEGGPVHIVFLEVRMLMQVGGLFAVEKVEARRPFEFGEVGGHWRLLLLYETRASCACGEILVRGSPARCASKLKRKRVGGGPALYVKVERKKERMKKKNGRGWC